MNRAQQPRKICPTVDATFSGHFHITSRMPVTWYSPARTQILKHVGYDYVTGSALEWNNSYAEEKCKPPAVTEFIKVQFIGNTSGTHTELSAYLILRSVFSQCLGCRKPE